MKINMKRSLAALLALLMIFSLAACGGKNKGSDKGGDKAETIVLDEYSAVFKGYTFVKDEDGEDAIVLTYDFTNGSKNEQSFAWAFLFEATQAGEALGSPGFDENYEPISANYEEEVQPGKSLEVKFALTLVNTTDDVIITFSDFYFHEYIQTIKLSGFDGKGSGSVEVDSEEVGSYTLYEMTASGETFDNDFLSSVGMDALYMLELNADGSGALTIDGDISPVTWKDVKITVTVSGAVYDYEYQGGKITLTETTGDVMVFQKTGAVGGSNTVGGLKPVGGNGSDTELTAYQQYWDGDWFGWMSYSNGTNDYASLDGFYWDCMARIDIDENGEGTLILWDEVTSVNNLRANMTIVVSDGGFAQGRLKSVEGSFSDGEVGNADWLVDPDGLDYEYLICIEGSYKDPADFFSGYDYTIYLRPWGLDWADIEEDHPDGLPDHYDWYLSAIESGADMPDVIGGDYGVTAHGEVPDSQTEGHNTGKLAPLSYPESAVIGAVMPSSFSYNSDWSSYIDAVYDVYIWVVDAKTYAGESEFTGAMASYSGGKNETLGGYTVHIFEDTAAIEGKTTRYFVELGGVSNLYGCLVKVSSVSDIAKTQTAAIKDMIASIAALS